MPRLKASTRCRSKTGPTAFLCLYYAYHVMVGLGTIFIAVSGIAAFLLWRRQLFDARWMLWILLLLFPLPYIANTAGWMTASSAGNRGWSMV